MALLVWVLGRELEEFEPHLRHAIIWQLRLPRLLLGLATGATLALSGLVLQILYSHPLADAQSLGIASGVALGAILSLEGGLPPEIGAMGGGVLFTALLAVASARSQRQTLEIGLGLGALAQQAVVLLLILGEARGHRQAHTVLGWLLGDLSHADLPGALLCTLSTLCFGMWIWHSRGALHALRLGELGARSVGVDVSQQHRRLGWAVALALTSVIAQAGMIGFLGFVVPACLRLCGGGQTSQLIRGSAFAGAIGLALSDWIGQHALRDAELPVSVIVGVWGLPAYWITTRRLVPRKTPF